MNFLAFSPCQSPDKTSAILHAEHGEQGKQISALNSPQATIAMLSKLRPNVIWPTNLIRKSGIQHCKFASYYI